MAGARTVNRLIYLHPSCFYPGAFWLKTVGLTGSRQSLPIGKPCGSFYRGEETEYLPFDDESSATAQAIKLAQSIADKGGGTVEETTWKGRKAWRIR